MPLGFESNLELLAISSTEYGAIIDSSVGPCLDDPSMVCITTKTRVDTLDVMGWKGFTADNIEDFK